MRIVSVTAQAWTLPLVAPFVIATRTATEARNVRIRVETEGELVGYGASAPVAYVTGESVETVLSALAAVAPAFEGQYLARLAPLLDLAARLSEAPAARAGLEMALYDAWGKGWKLPLWQHFGGATTRLTTDITVPLVAPEEAAHLAESAWREGFRALKIKVGDSLGQASDLTRIEAITRAAPLMRLRIDANQAFEPVAAVAFAEELIRMGALVELLEQPVAKEDIAGLSYVKKHIDIPVFADESARSVAEVVHLLREDAVDGINVKLMKSGITGALEIMTLCRAVKKKLMLGCMLETRLGIAAAAQIAGGTGGFDYLDLDSHRLLRPVTGLSGGFECAGEEIWLGESGAAGWGVAST